MKSPKKNTNEPQWFSREKERINYHKFY